MQGTEGKPHMGPYCHSSQQDKRSACTWYVTSGLSDWLSREMDESASGGKMSTRALEWRCSAMEALGFSSSLFRVDRIRT